MAWEHVTHRESFEAAEDLSSDQYRFVVLTSDTIRRPDSVLEKPFGVLDNDPESGEIGTVNVQGIAKVVAGETLTAYEFVKPEYVSATDAGKAVVCSPSDPNCAGYVLVGAAEDELATIWLTGPRLTNYYGIKRGAAATVSTAGAATYTAAQVLGGLILRDPAGDDRSDVTPTAALIIAAMGDTVEVGDYFEFTIRNTADAAETITVTAGTDVTLSGTMTIAQNNSKRFRVEVTAADAVTIYSLGTVVH